MGRGGRKHVRSRLIKRSKQLTHRYKNVLMKSIVLRHSHMLTKRKNLYMTCVCTTHLLFSENGLKVSGKGFPLPDLLRLLNSGCPLPK